MNRFSEWRSHFCIGRMSLSFGKWPRWKRLYSNHSMQMRFESRWKLFGIEQSILGIVMWHWAVIYSFQIIENFQYLWEYLDWIYCAWVFLFFSINFRIVSCCSNYIKIYWIQNFLKYFADSKLLIAEIDKLLWNYLCFSLILGIDSKWLCSFLGLY